MQLNKNYKIGLRAIKTAIAVYLCALIAMFFNHEDIFAACIAAVICMEQTFELTVQSGINRFIGTIIGGIVGYTALELAYIVPHYDWLRIIILPVCIIIVVYICNIIDKKQSVQIGCVVVIIILARLGDKTDSTLNYVLQRVLDTFLGILIATAVNRFTFAKHSKMCIMSEKQAEKCNPND